AELNQSLLDSVGSAFSTMEDVLKEVRDDSHKEIGSWEMMRGEEKAEVVLLGRGRRIQAEGETIKQVIRRQAERRADAVALVYEDEQLSYGEMWRRAVKVGEYLRRKEGLRPESLVGVSMERNIEMVVAVMGVVAGGGGYVPVDVRYPAGRVEYMLEDAGGGGGVVDEEGEGKGRDGGGKEGRMERVMGGGGGGGGEKERG